MTRDELIELWCQALESGEYVQGKNYLKVKTPTGEKHCCLGVGCELAISHGVKLDEDADSWCVKFSDHYASLPNPVKEFLGLRTSTGRFEDKRGETDFLTELNDHGHTFKEIAALIRSRPKGLFVEES